MNKSNYRYEVDCFVRDAIEATEMKEQITEDYITLRAEAHELLSSRSKRLELLAVSDSPDGFYQMYGKPEKWEVEDFDTLLELLATAAFVHDALDRLAEIRGATKEVTKINVREALVDLGFAAVKNLGHGTVYKKPGLQDWQVTLHEQTHYKRYTIESKTKAKSLSNQWQIRTLVETPINDNSKLEFLSKLYSVLAQELGN